MRLSIAITALGLILLAGQVVGQTPTVTGAASAEDWPAWRYSAGRTAATPHELPAVMTLKWSREFPAPQPAWPWEPRQAFDLVYEPIVADGTLFVGLHCDKLLALDAETGDEKWSFFAEGPIRFAPVYWKGRVIFASDDGNLYCLDVGGGKLLWKFLAAPAERIGLGNGRLISSWPARGAPVLADDKVYFAAGIWPFMGVSICAVEAETGKAVWKNDKTGAISPPNPHGSKGVGGPSPQGYLAAAGGKLIVPSGRSRPAIFDLKSGQLVHYMTGWKYGNSFVAATEKFYFNGGLMFDLKTGGLGPCLSVQGRKAPALWSLWPVLDGDTAYVVEKNVCAYDLQSANIPDNTSNHDYEHKFIQSAPASAWKGSAADADAVWLKAGKRLYVSRGQNVTALDLPEGKESWNAPVKGTIGGMIAARGKLFVSTREGGLYCFGAAGTGRTYPAVKPPAPPADESSRKAAAILEACKTPKGYCLVLGLKDGRLIEELVNRSELHVIGVDGDAAKVDGIRRRLDEAGLYGRRASLRVGDPAAFALPPYIASLIVSEDWNAVKGGFSAKLYSMLRPYGGAACLDAAIQADAAAMPGAEKKSAGAFTLIVRAGALAGSAWWNHENADSANTCAPQDDLAKAPLAVLWFGARPQDANEYEKLFPDRHSGAPRPQAAGGRLIVQRCGRLSAFDVYTGRMLWTREMPGLYKQYEVSNVRTPIDKYQGYRPRSTATLGNRCVTLPDCIYICLGEKCLRLDPETGKDIPEFKPPDNVQWGHIAVWEDLLIAGISVQSWDAGKDWSNQLGIDHWNAASSAQLVAMDRVSGKMLWKRDAVFGFRHSGIAVGGGKVFCIDNLPQDALDCLKRKVDAGAKPALLALDIRTGKEVWTTAEDMVRSPCLAYSEKHDILIRGLQGSNYLTPGMTAEDVTNKLIAYQGKDGKTLWNTTVKAYWTTIVSDETLIHGSAYNLRTGKSLWSWAKPGKGCDPPLGSKHLLTFRSSSSAYYDIEHKKGPIHLSGIRPSCSGSLIAADGLLNAPMSGSGCDCNIQNLASMALIYEPELEKWNPEWCK
ncbi:MAG: PQQ-binding-like beta-propeller repeat protein [Planctomycetes bacterium]|nr:PQQ-binding-like beta-propeller repeat protein [Planctomycetota bacterium]